jgi:hypothetical protein
MGALWRVDVGAAPWKATSGPLWRADILEAGGA